MKSENATKQRIRETALDLFAKKSFEAVTLNEICKASGVNKHSFYYYFKSKDDILDKFYEIPCQLEPADLERILATDSYVEKLWLLMKTNIDYPDRYGVSIIRQIFIKNLTSDVGTFMLSEKQKEMLRLQQGIIDKGKACGQFQSNLDSSMLMILLRQSIHSLLLAWCIKNGSFSFPDACRFFYETLFQVPDALRTMKESPLPAPL